MTVTFWDFGNHAYMSSMTPSSLCECVCVCPRRGEKVKKRAGQCRSKTSRLGGLLRWHDGTYSVRHAPRFKAQLELSQFQPPTPCGEQKLLMAWVCVCHWARKMEGGLLERWREQAWQMLAPVEVTYTWQWSHSQPLAAILLLVIKVINSQGCTKCPTGGTLVAWGSN